MMTGKYSHYFEDIHIAATLYRKYLCNRDFCIIFDNNIYDFKQVGCKGLHFQHLIKIKSKGSAMNFYNRALNNRISVNDLPIDVVKINQMQEKLQSFKDIGYLFNNHSLEGDFNRTGEVLEAKYFVGSTSKTITIGFDSSNSIYDFPRTLLSDSVKKYVIRPKKVFAVFSKDNKDKKYRKCSYRNKDFNIYKTPLSVQSLLSEEIINEEIGKQILFPSPENFNNKAFSLFLDYAYPLVKDNYNRWDDTLFNKYLNSMILDKCPSPNIINTLQFILIRPKNALKLVERKTKKIYLKGR